MYFPWQLHSKVSSPWIQALPKSSYVYKIIVQNVLKTCKIHIKHFKSNFVWFASFSLHHFLFKKVVFFRIIAAKELKFQSSPSLCDLQRKLQEFKYGEVWLHGQTVQRRLAAGLACHSIDCLPFAATWGHTLLIIITLTKRTLHRRNVAAQFHCPDWKANCNRNYLIKHTSDRLSGPEAYKTESP